MTKHKSSLRIARPTDRLAEIVQMYADGLGFEILGSFTDHDGFDGVFLGQSGQPYHLEFTHHRGTTVGRAPTRDNLLIFYMPDKALWERACERMVAAGFERVDAYNPYWGRSGQAFEDLDGYGVVLANRASPV